MLPKKLGHLAKGFLEIDQPETRIANGMFVNEF